MSGPSVPDAEVREEMRNVVRHFQRFTPEQRATMRASSRLGPNQRERVGQYFYTHPDAPGVSFKRRRGAAWAVVRRRHGLPA